jgi:hypothetical protein
LTPNTAKFLQIPALTDSNSQPTTSTHFSATTKILPTKNLPSRNSNPQPPNLQQNLSQPHNQDNKILHPPPTKSTKPTPKSSNPETDTQNYPKTQKSVSARQALHQATHAKFQYPPTVETFFDNDTDNDSQHEPKLIPATFPDTLMSSTRTNFTYLPVEDHTKTLLKYSKNANLCKLAYPTNLQAQRRHFNTFIDNPRIVCNIFPWLRQVFDL